MSRKLLLFTAALWLLLVGAIVGLKEYTLRTGQEVLLKTEPVDPRDLFRGDYVILNYEISTLDTGQFQLAFDRDLLEAGRTDVMVALEVDDEGYARATGIHIDRPEGLFIKGRLTSGFDHVISIDYGIESFFVPEGTGHMVERLPEGLLEVRVVIDRFGHAAIASLLVAGEELQF